MSIPIPTLSSFAKSSLCDSVIAEIRSEYGFLELDFTHAEQIYRQHYWSIDATFSGHLFTVIQERLAHVPSHFEPVSLTFHCILKGVPLTCKFSTSGYFGYFFDQKMESYYIEIPQVFHLEALEFLKNFAQGSIGLDASNVDLTSNKTNEDFYSRLSRREPCASPLSTGVGRKKRHLLRTSKTRVEGGGKGVRSNSSLKRITDGGIS